MGRTPMPRSSASSLSFPPFQGAVRKLVFANVAVYFAFLLLDLFSRSAASTLRWLLWLRPASVASGAVWQLVTYSFLHLDLLSILFTMLTLWFCGSLIEGAYGRRWFAEQYFGLRNAYYKAKRRRAAKKFEVYMGKQGRHVKFDDEGRYIEPDDPRKRDPNDKRWMN